MILAPGFPVRWNVDMASGFPELSTWRVHGIEGTTHLSSFARASEVSLRCSVSSDEPSKMSLSFGELLGIWSLLHPRLLSPLVVVSLIVWAISPGQMVPSHVASSVTSLAGVHVDRVLEDET